MLRIYTIDCFFFTKNESVKIWGLSGWNLNVSAYFGYWRTSSKMECPSIPCPIPIAKCLVSSAWCLAKCQVPRGIAHCPVHRGHCVVVLSAECAHCPEFTFCAQPPTVFVPSALWKNFGLTGRKEVPRIEDYAVYMHTLWSAFFIFNCWKERPNVHVLF